MMHVLQKQVVKANLHCIVDTRHMGPRPRHEYAEVHSSGEVILVCKVRHEIERESALTLVQLRRGSWRISEKSFAAFAKTGD